jgi:hypothetical protein
LLASSPNGACRFSTKAPTVPIPLDANAGVVKYAISDAFQFTIKSPVNIQLTENSAGFITNLTFSSQEEGLQQFDNVQRLLNAIKSNTVHTLKPLATLPQVCRL